MLQNEILPANELIRGPEVTPAPAAEQTEELAAALRKRL